MPAKSIESLGIEDEYVLKWLRKLYGRTATNYGSNFVRFMKWCDENGFWASGKEIIENAKQCSNSDEIFDNHMEVIFDFIRSLNVGTQYKKSLFNGIKSFYEFYRIPLPKLTKTDRKELFRASEKDKERARLKPLQLEEVKKLIMNIPQPIKSAYALMFQSAMGSAEFNQFNTGEEWKELLKTKKKSTGEEYKEINTDQPTQINLIREKTSTETPSEFFTFIAKDSKDLISEWLDMRPKEADNLGCLFVVWNKPKKKYVPLKAYVIADHMRFTAKKIGLIEDNGLNYYHTHLHELRDLFKSLCSLNGVNKIASEFFLGHDIDRLGYDKSPKYDVDFFKEEYSRVAPVLNIFSANGEVKKKIDQVANEFEEKLSKKDEENQELRKQNEVMQEQINQIMEDLKDMKKKQGSS